MHHNKQQDVHHLLPSRKSWRWVAVVRNNRVRVIYGTNANYLQCEYTIVYVVSLSV